MPNWMHTTLKAKGTEKSLKVLIEKLGIILIEDIDMFINSRLELGKNANCCLGLFSRSFVDGDLNYDFFPIEEEDSEKYILTMSGIETAWSLENENFSEICKENDLCIKLHGYEFGVFFEQIKEWNELGKIIVDKVKSEDDCEKFVWECENTINTGV